MNPKQTFDLILRDICRKLNIELETEYRFCSSRRFRSDYAIIPKRILIEYEGGIYMPKGGHTNVAGYASNCDKYNLAQSMGFKVYRFTAAHMKKDSIEETIEFMMAVLK